jgi:adenylate kinase
MNKGPGAGAMGAVFVVMGPPNAGKGTQTRLLGEHLRAVHFSTGELMRKENDPKIMQLTNTGALAPNDYIRDMVAREIRRAPHDKPIVIDGAKMLPEAKWLVDFLPTVGRSLSRVVLIRLTEDASRARSASRGHGREDDAEHVQDVRWERFRRDVTPTIEFYRGLGVLEEVDGSGTQGEVAFAIRGALGV